MLPRRADLGDGAGRRPGDRVVAAEDDRDRAGRGDLADLAEDHRVGALEPRRARCSRRRRRRRSGRRAARARTAVARRQLQAVERAGRVVRLADRARPEPGAGPVADRVVERGADDRDVRRAGRGARRGPRPTAASGTRPGRRTTGRSNRVEHLVARRPSRWRDAKSGPPGAGVDGRSVTRGISGDGPSPATGELLRPAQRGAAGSCRRPAGRAAAMLAEGRTMTAPPEGRQHEGGDRRMDRFDRFTNRARKVLTLGAARRPRSSTTTTSGRSTCCWGSSR